MARGPVTAKQKLDEAVHFYNEMATRRTNVVVFPYYLSAFVSALRSVTFYLQKQYRHDNRFTSWYEQRQEEMKADPVLRLLKQQRNKAVHEEPFDLFFNRGFKFPERYGDAITITTYLDVREETSPAGDLNMFLKVGEDGMEEMVEAQITWHFSQEDPEDVMDHCYEGLAKLAAMLKELHAIGLVPVNEESSASSLGD